MNSEFAGKTIIITGASAGVGAACARAFAAQKANLVLSARGQGGLDRIADELSPSARFLPLRWMSLTVNNVWKCSLRLKRSLVM